jgi:hypothetical protein
MRATPWPNGLGWDVGRHEVWRLPRGELGVALFLPGERYPYRWLQCPADTDPVNAVRQCLAHGHFID